MKALDTNVLVRYFVQDDAAQAKLANTYIVRYCTSAHPGFINSIVLCELVWVLESAYGYSKSQIVPLIEKMLQTSQFEVEHIESAWKALENYSSMAVDFTDAYISMLNKAAGCQHTATFDKRAAKLKEFELL